MKFLLTGNSTYMNHGSEAIVRGTTIILNKYFGQPEIISAEIEFFPYANIPETDNQIIHYPLYIPKPHSLPWFWQQTKKAMLTRPVAAKLYARKLLPEVSDASAVLSIGGDAYIDQPFIHVGIDNVAVKQGVPLVLWGASVGPFSGSAKYQKTVFDHLRQFTGIFVREKISIEYLARNGIHENVYLVDDPAFVMPPQKPPDDIIARMPEDAIGLSLSPLFYNKTKWKLSKAQACADVIDAIRTKFKRPIILIPHCVADFDNDYDFLDNILQEHAHRWPDVVCIPKMMPAAQIKWIISGCYTFVGARMHAVIAALASNVPTLSLMYSYKGAGINLRVFDSLDYAIECNQCDPQSIVEKLAIILKQRKEIHEMLVRKNPEIQAGAFRAGEILSQLMGCPK